MFTLKKIALLGVAGLAAFSMSCSDSDDDASSIGITTPVVTATGTGEAAVYGMTGGGLITSATAIDSVGIALVNAAGANIPLIVPVLPYNFPVLGVTEFDILPYATYMISSAALSSCPKGTTVEAYMQVSAWSGTVTSSVNSNAFTFTCPAADIEIPNLGGAFNDTTNVTLGGTGAAGSAIDFDATVLPPNGITRAQLNADATLKNKVDVVYNGTNLYTVDAARDAAINGGTLAGGTAFSYLVPVTANQIQSIDASSTPVADAIIIATSSTAGDVHAVSAGANFLVITTENAAVILTVVSKNGTEDGIFMVVRAL